MCRPQMNFKSGRYNQLRAHTKDPSESVQVACRKRMNRSELRDLEPGRIWRNPMNNSNTHKPLTRDLNPPTSQPSLIPNTNKQAADIQT
ncbi:hypothetical protein YC2023_094033 [Brassica napus]